MQHVINNLLLVVGLKFFPIFSIILYLLVLLLGTETLLLSLREGLQGQRYVPLFLVRLTHSDKWTLF